MTGANEPTNIDVATLVREALSAHTGNTTSASTTSDLSIDEELNLHAIGWEPVELVSGYSVFSTPARSVELGARRDRRGRRGARERLSKRHESPL